MARIQYQGAARASGYRPQQVDEERKLARLRQEGERRLQGMRAVADAEMEERRRMLQAMKEDEAYTKGAMDRDYRIATGNQQRVAESLQAQAKRDRDQFNIDTKSRTEALNSVKAFSDTAKKEADKVYERERTQNFLDEVANGMSEENLLGKAVQQTLLAEMSVQGSNARQIAVAKGADPVTSAQLRANDDAMATDFTEGQIAAYWRWQYADDRTAYLARKAKEKGQALTPEEEQRYTGEFRQQVIQLMGEQSGFASKLITPYVQQYGDAADTALFAETRRRQKQIADDRTFNMGEANIANADPANIQRVLHTSVNLMVEAKGYTAAFNSLQKIYEAIDPETGKPIRDRNELANYTFIDENGKKTTFAKKFENTRYADVIRNLDRAQTQWAADKQTADRVNRQEWLNNQISQLPENYTAGDVDRIDAMIRDQYPGWNPPELTNMRKRGTLEARVRTAELEAIASKQSWELTQRDVDFVKTHGTATQHASVKSTYDNGNGAIYSKGVDKIINDNKRVITGQNSYSDLAKAGSGPAALAFDRNVRSTMRRLLSVPEGQEGYITGSTLAERAENAATVASELEMDKVTAGTHGYKKKTFRNGRVEYPELLKSFGSGDAITANENRVQNMRQEIIEKGAGAFVQNPDSIFTDERIQALMQNPDLPPDGFEIATAKALGISQHSLRNLGAKAKGFKFDFKDTLLEGTGVAYTPELARTMGKLGPSAQRAALDSRMGNVQNFQNLGVHGRPGMSQQLAQFVGIPVEQTKEYPIVLENGQPIRIAYGPASEAFDKMLADGFPTEGITNVFRDEKEYLRLRKAGYGAAPNSYHNHGLAIDAHGVSLLWLKKYGAKYGWVHEPGYVGHGGHFIFKPSI
jgi:hypothetical protein